MRGSPVRSLAMRCSACAGLYVAGRGFLMRGPPGLERFRCGGGYAAAAYKVTTNACKSKCCIDLHTSLDTRSVRRRRRHPALTATPFLRQRPVHARESGRETVTPYNARSPASVVRSGGRPVPPSARGRADHGWRYRYSHPCGRRQMRRPTRHGFRSLTSGAPKCSSSANDSLMSLALAEVSSAQWSSSASTVMG